MNIAIVGSRDFKNLHLVEQMVQRIARKYPDATIVSGGARGVDTAAEQAAIKAGLKTNIFPAEWEKYGRRAGFMRNQDIVQACDILIAFWDGRSKGTLSSIQLAQSQQRDVFIYKDRA